MRNSQGFEFYPGRRLGVVCRDGVVRSAVLTGYASGVVPAMVQVTVDGRRRSVSGFISQGKPLPATPELLRQLGIPPFDYKFTSTGRNADLIPWTNHKPRLANLARRMALTSSWGLSCPGYAWDIPSDHAFGLSKVCRDRLNGLPLPNKGWPFRRLLKSLSSSDLLKLEKFFITAGRLFELHGE
jgi:hypothetical protein